MTHAKPMLILGAGSFAIEVLDVAELTGVRVAGFVVSDDQVPATRRHADLPIFAEGEVPFAPDEVALIGGIVTTRRRAFVERMAARGFAFRTLTHPSAIVSPRARIDAGALVGAGVIVASHTHIGAHVLLNRGANVGHDNVLEPFVTIGPGAILAGAVRVGAGAYVGVGAVVRDHLEIGAGAVVAAGAVVVKPVEAHVLVAGVPAASVKRDVDGL
jgi:sugar O-acyltransferase (sialic acid O-acetyltransferase NeuD family)